METILTLSIPVVAILEVIAALNWNPKYFQFGIPIYSKEYEFRGTADSQIGEVALNEAFYINDYKSRLKFKEIDIGIFAFKYELPKKSLIGYFPIMRGRIKINQMSRKIKISGLANWWVVAITAIYLSRPGLEASFLSVLSLYLLVIYFLQKRAFDKLGRFVYEWNSGIWD